MFRMLVCAAAAAAWLFVAGTALADDESDPPNAAVDEEAVSGPVLVSKDPAPLVCDVGTAALRFVEVRGAGFDAWATQRLVGNVVDASGAQIIDWQSIWVSPQGRLTLEVNVCADPFRNRPPLAPGDYTVSVGTGAGAPIAATTISLTTRDL